VEELLRWKRERCWSVEKVHREVVQRVVVLGVHIVVVDDASTISADARSKTGIPLSVNPPSPMPSWTVCCTTALKSN
jgi:hypothetical protein